MSVVQNQSHARPYAEAAYRFAKQHTGVAAWSDFLSFLAELLSNPALTALVNNPLLDQVTIVHALLEGLPAQITSEESNFLLLLAENRRLIYCPAVYDYFQQLRDQDEGILRATVTSAFPLNETTLANVEKKLTQKFQKQIVLESAVNPDLIGGLKIQIGDRVLGASVQDMLAQLIQNVSSHHILRDHNKG